MSKNPPLGSDALIDPRGMEAFRRIERAVERLRSGSYLDLDEKRTFEKFVRSWTLRKQIAGDRTIDILTMVLDGSRDFAKMDVLMQLPKGQAARLFIAGVSDYADKLEAMEVVS